MNRDGAGVVIVRLLWSSAADLESDGLSIERLPGAPDASQAAGRGFGQTPARLGESLLPLH